MRRTNGQTIMESNPRSVRDALSSVARISSNITNPDPSGGDPGGGETGSDIGYLFHENNTQLFNSSRPPFSSTSPFPGYINISDKSFEEPMPPWYSDIGNTSLCDDWNSTMCYNSTNSTDAMHTEHEKRFWAIILLIFPFFTVFGNVLVCLSVYREKSLKTVTNYFIVSLAVADIMVAVLVMPLAVYVEVQNGDWFLGNALCDTYVAMDVMCCTASILNLTAISVDRFIAVTQPIKYARHKNSKRTHISLGITWVVSIAISAPIALGMNYTERRHETPQLCTFYNSDFLIYSSMGSFYIPCVIMILLYWRIFRAIRIRARKSKAAKSTAKLKFDPPNKGAIKNIIENKAQTGRTTTSEASATEGDMSQRELLAASKTKNSLAKKTIREETSFTNFNANSTPTETDEQEECNISMNRLPMSDDTDSHVIQNDRQNQLLLSPTSDEAPAEFRDIESGYSAPTVVTVEVTTQTPETNNCPIVANKTLLSPPPARRTLGLYNKNHNTKKKSKQSQNGHGNSPVKKSVTKFNFHLRHSKKKTRSNNANRRERKATKTLAIVLGVFLFCWVPFFTINIMNAICIRYDLFEKRPECNMDPILFSFFVWLGYINSFLNPVIYTIFNVEFRKAFKKILNCN